MDLEGYPEEEELELIRKWDIKDSFGLIKYIKERWAYHDSIKETWIDDEFNKGKKLLRIEFHTCGWSGNESLIYALLDNHIFKAFCYVEWHRGGHYYFEIKPHALGYKTVNETSKEKGISRQYIHQSINRYDVIQMAGSNRKGKIKLIRLKQQNNQQQ